MDKQLRFIVSATDKNTQAVFDVLNKNLKYYRTQLAIAKISQNKLGSSSTLLTNRMGYLKNQIKKTSEEKSRFRGSLLQTTRVMNYQKTVANQLYNVTAKLRKENGRWKTIQEKMTPITHKNNEIIAKQTRTVLSQKKVNGEMVQVSKRQVMQNGKWVTSNENMVLGAKRFKMELLSVMFFGMAMQKAFAGLTQGSDEYIGVMNNLTVSMTEFFEPQAEAKKAMADWTADMMDNSGETTKWAANSIAMLGEFGGAGLMAFGQLGLGVDGMRMAFPVLGKGFKGIKTAGGLMYNKIKGIGPMFGKTKGMSMGLFGGLTKLGSVIRLTVIPSLIAMIVPILPIIIIIGAVIAIVALLWLAWEKDFGNIRKHTENIINYVKNIFNGFKTFLSGIIDVVVGILTLNPEKIKKGFQKIIDGAKKIFSGFLGIGKEIIGFIADGIRQAGHLIAEALYNIPIIGPLIKSVITGVGAVGSAVVSGIRGILGLADGGIVTRPTLAMVGERGPEAVIPLNKRGGIGGTYNFNPSISIEVSSIKSDSDIRELASKLNKYMFKDFERLMK